MTNDIIIRFSEGRGNLGKVKNRTLTWPAFKNKFREPTRTRETFHAYKNLSLADKLGLKKMEGFFFAAPCRDGSRKKEDVLDRDMLTIDIDENAHGLPEMLADGTSGISQYEFMAHSSRSHSPENPKIRLIMPTNRQVLREEHQPLSRIVSQMISADMRMIDPVSHRLAQMMFKPSCSKDSEYLFIENEGALLDVDAIFAHFKKTVGDWMDFSLLPRNPDKEKDLRNTLDKAEDPTTKEGPVGVFCRAYAIEELIEDHLGDFYFEADHTGSDVRYTAHGSQGSAGCVVYDDGKFMYSNHTSDPCSEQLVNAWDMARLCLFGDKDVDVQAGTKIANLPSSKEMLAFAQRDDKFRNQQMSEKFDMDAMLDDELDDDDLDGADFGEEPLGDSVESEEQSNAQQAIDDLIGGPSDEDDSQPSGEKKKRKVKKDWITELETDKQGNVLPTYLNATRIITNDKRLRDKLAFNELEQEVVLLETITTRNDYIPDIILTSQQAKAGGVVWTDLHDATTRGIMAEPNGPGRTGYGMDPPERTMRDAVVAVSQHNKFHPIRDFLATVTHDGIPRLATFCADYLGCMPDQYHAEVFTNTMVAAVTRTYEPGHKFDNLPIFEGGQGARKSTLVEIMGMRKWYLELTGDLSDSKAMAEQTRGCVFAELAEMTAHRKADVDATKSFLSRRKEKVRMAYAKKSVDVMRQYIPIGTTNEYEYLKDPTGNRRMWPIRVRVKKIDIDAIEAIMPQLWAEAAAIYRAMRVKTPYGDLWLDLRSDVAREIHAAATMQATATTPEDELAGQIDEWSIKPVPYATMLDAEDTLDNDDYDRMIWRTKVCVHHVAAEVLGASKTGMKSESMFIARAMQRASTLTRCGSKYRFARGIGQQRAFELTAIEFSAAERTRGFAFVDEHTGGSNNDLI